MSYYKNFKQNEKVYVLYCSQLNNKTVKRLNPEIINNNLIKIYDSNFQIQLNLKKQNSEKNYSQRKLIDLFKYVEIFIIFRCGIIQISK